MDGIESKIQQEKEKPPLLYHGSPHGEIEEFEPKVSPGSGEKYGPLVYATPDEATARIFMMRVNGSWSAGRFWNVPYVLIPMSREEFLKNDKGGHVYVLSSEQFSSDPSRGLGEYEWASKEKVKPIEKKEYPSALQAVLESGVQVYFLDPETYKKTREANDHGFSILQQLESENQKQGIGVREFSEEDNDAELQK
jgi:hypothetical protein